MNWTRIGHLKTARAFADYAEKQGLELPCDERVLAGSEGSPLARPLDVGGFVVGNRWCIHPMEGWDSLEDGTPSEHTLRRWEHFGQSGGKLIWGGEAFAVQEDGRSNPRQIGVVGGDLARAERGLVALYERLVRAHQEKFGTIEGLFIGLQLTHSGRFSFPHEKARREPVIAYHHPVLDRRCGIAATDDQVVASDDFLRRLVDNYIAAARLAKRVGFHFVDVKHCHGYLGHELLSAYTRRGLFGGSFENRTRFLRLIVEGIKAACPGLQIGVRLSAFDTVPHRPNPATTVPGKMGEGIPEEYPRPYPYGFGLNPENPLEMDLREPIELMKMLSGLGVRLINVTCCSPYYVPHMQRPAAFPPSDGYQPPEDPLIGVERHIRLTRLLKEAAPESIVVGSGYTYLQDFLPQVAQAVVRAGWTDFVGIGRMVLSYWDLIADSLEGRGVTTQRICRTFSDCTSAPRAGLISGCYPLDKSYKVLPEHEQLKAFKVAGRK